MSRTIEPKNVRTKLLKILIFFLLVFLTCCSKGTKAPQLQQRFLTILIVSWQLLHRQTEVRGARGPDEWMPAINRCSYAQRWEGLIEKYGLLITNGEMVAIGRACQQFINHDKPWQRLTSSRHTTPLFHQTTRQLFWFDTQTFARKTLLQFLSSTTTNTAALSSPPVWRGARL